MISRISYCHEFFIIHKDFFVVVFCWKIRENSKFVIVNSWKHVVSRSQVFVQQIVFLVDSWNLSKIRIWTLTIFLQVWQGFFFFCSSESIWLSTYTVGFYSIVIAKKVFLIFDHIYHVYLMRGFQNYDKNWILTVAFWGQTKARQKFAARWAELAVLFCR